MSYTVMTDPNQVVSSQTEYSWNSLVERTRFKISHCEAHPGTNCLSSIFTIYDSKGNDAFFNLAKKIFEELRSKASVGRTTMSIKFIPECKNSLFCVWIILQKWISVTDVDSLLVSSCATDFKKIYFDFTWKSDDSYLNPRPPLPMGFAICSVLQVLNQERRDGKGDCTIKFGTEHLFSVHKSVLLGASPLFKTKLIPAMSQATTSIIELPEIKGFTRDELEFVLDMIYEEPYAVYQEPDFALRLLDLGFRLQLKSLIKKAFDCFLPLKEIKSYFCQNIF